MQVLAGTPQPNIPAPNCQASAVAQPDSTHTAGAQSPHPAALCCAGSSLQRGEGSATGLSCSMPASPLFCAPAAPAGLDCECHRWDWPGQPVSGANCHTGAHRHLVHGKQQQQARIPRMQPTNEDAGGGVRNNIWPPAVGRTRGAAAACISTALRSLKQRRRDGHACMQGQGAAKQASLAHHCKPGLLHDRNNIIDTT